MADPVTTPIAPPSAPLPWWVVPGMVYTIILAFLAFAGIIVWRQEDKYEQIVLIAVIGLTTSGIGFYVGSSKASESKDSTIAGTAAALATSSPAPTQTDEVDPKIIADASTAAEALRKKLGAAS